MANFSVDATLLNIRQARSPWWFLLLGRVSILGLCRGQRQDLELVGGQALAEKVLRRDDDGVVGEGLQVERRERPLISRNLRWVQRCLITIINIIITHDD
jgi:hypothetical protein